MNRNPIQTSEPAPSLGNSVPVALVEDDRFFGDYVESVLQASGRYHLIARATSAEEALAWPATLKSAVLLLDVVLPGKTGPMAVAAFLAKWPALKIVMLTGQDGDEPLLESIRAGASGYLLKGGGSDAIVEALCDAMSGGAPMSPSIARKVLALLREPTAVALERSIDATAADLRMLTERERAVLALLAEGDADKEICEKLGVARSTVKNHLTSIYDKWRVRSRTQAAIKFVKVVNK